MLAANNERSFEFRRSVFNIVDKESLKQIPNLYACYEQITSRTTINKLVETCYQRIQKNMNEGGEVEPLWLSLLRDTQSRPNFVCPYVQCTHYQSRLPSSNEHPEYYSMCKLAFIFLNCLQKYMFYKNETSK